MDRLAGLGALLISFGFCAAVYATVKAHMQDGQDRCLLLAYESGLFWMFFVAGIQLLLYGGLDELLGRSEDATLVSAWAPSLIGFALGSFIGWGAYKVIESSVGF